jgi:hypothetical protein
MVAATNGPELFSGAHSELHPAVQWFMDKQDDGLAGMPLSEALNTMYQEIGRSDEQFRILMDTLVEIMREGTTTPEQSYNIVRDFHGHKAAQAWSRIMQSFGW